MTDEEIRALVDEFRQKADADPEIRSVMEKIRNQEADLDDTSRLCLRRSELMGQFMQDQLPELTPGDRERLCTALLRNGYDVANEAVPDVLRAQDERLGLHLNPVRAPFPQERVQKVSHSLEDPGITEEQRSRRAGAPVANTGMSFHDDSVKENARIRAKLGFKCYLNRVAASGCCKWCTDIAGRYVYGDHPVDIFRRHDNCGCTVTFENGRQRQDVWSKQTWQASPAEILAQYRGPKKLTKEQAEFLGLTFGKNRGKIKSEESDNIWSKIKSILTGKTKQSELQQQEIEEALKSLGFSSVDPSFFKKVDKTMQVSITDQLKQLEDRFHAIGRSDSPYLIADLKGGAIGSCQCNMSQPDRQHIRLSTTAFKSRKSHISNRKKEIEDFYCMPCLNDDETVSRYVITHEYGHMLENSLIAEQMRGTIHTHKRLAENYKDQIEKIAREIDQNYDQNKANYLSEYGHKNDLEFFAECFANSQLGEPNVLGQAMAKWLERRGL